MIMAESQTRQFGSTSICKHVASYLPFGIENFQHDPAKLTLMKRTHEAEEGYEACNDCKGMEQNPYVGKDAKKAAEWERGHREGREQIREEQVE
jgi:hypothetical protein